MADPTLCPHHRPDDGGCDPLCAQHTNDAAYGGGCEADEPCWNAEQGEQACAHRGPCQTCTFDFRALGLDECTVCKAAKRLSGADQ